MRLSWGAGTLCSVRWRPPLAGPQRPCTAARTSCTARLLRCARNCCGAARRSASATTQCQATPVNRWRRWWGLWRASKASARATGACLADPVDGPRGPALLSARDRNYSPDSRRTICHPAGPVMRDLRQVKDADEARLLRLAAQAADRSVDAIAAGRLVGRTEAEVSREIRGRLIDEGHEMADFAIVGSGPNGGSPHHDAGGRRIEAGEPVVLDLGGTLAGYLSDTTRTIWVAGETGIEPEPEFRRVYELVREAQSQATAAVRPGVPAERIDATARELIAAAGYGDLFTHRVGHGIGLEVHEDPYMIAGNTTPLRPGMAFSVEPGIYMPGRWGVRLENVVMCGANGAEVLNQSD